MKKIIFILLLILSFDVKAISTIVMDADSERILYQNNAYEKRLIASTTKIMTFVVAYEYGYYLLSETVTVGNEVLKMYGTSIYLKPQEKLTLKDLLYGLMLRSGNDAAIAIASYFGGNEDKFVKLMNEKAKEIGMHNTVFNNSHGLDEETQNYSTAYDMALLANYALKIPLYREITSTKYYKTQSNIKSYAWTNRNKLLFMYDKLTTGKTGYTPSAGKCLVSTAHNKGLNLTIVTLDDTNHYINHQNLYNKYFALYRNYIVIYKNNFNRMHQYTKEKVYINSDIRYPLKKNELEDIKYNVNLYQYPRKNEFGYLELLLKDKVVFRKKIYLKNVKKNVKKTFWQRLNNFFRLKL